MLLYNTKLIIQVELTHGLVTEFLQVKLLSTMNKTTYFQVKTRSAANQFNSLSRYLLHKRWVWTVQQPGVNSVSMANMGKILSTLAK